ncbi:hypothetical protein [Pseudomonas benzenivorans]|uniref:hypothetical protein n=1 Tax=Pseudomonas benzenivorans TaxID=556533 RepID=UPI003F81152D
MFNLYSAEEETLEGFDSIVLAVRHLPVTDLYHALKVELENVHRVGDCVVPRKTDHAIFEEFLAGREIFDNWKRYIEPGSIEQLNGPIDCRALGIIEIHKKIAGQNLRGALVATMGKAKLLSEALRIFDPHRKLFTDIGDMGRPIQCQEDGKLEIG